MTGEYRKEDKAAISDTIAIACRLLAYLGLVRETTGHVSARIDSKRMLIRCRGPHEAGLLFTQSESVREVDLDGSNLEGADLYEAPSELPIHGELYRARPDVGAVVHAHPHASMICTIAKLELKPVFGGFDPHAMTLGDMNVPVFPRSVLVRTPEIARQIIEMMGGKPVCLLYGHGVVTTGRTVQEATLRAIQLETLARMNLEVAKTGATPVSISDEDLAYFREVTSAQAAKARRPAKDLTNWLWRHYVRLLEAHESR